MTQSDCLSLPSHVTYLGVCYPSSYLTLGISSANNPVPVSFSTAPTSVPEPDMSLFVLLAVAVLFWRKRIQ